MIKNPLYGHDSESNAYLVSGYPYGSLKCNIKFWLEYKDKKGYRLVTRTENPKNGRWNNPKTSTYSLIAGCLYLDEKNHVHWDCLSEYSSADDTLKFIQNFPKAITPFIKYWVHKKHSFILGLINGSIAFTIAGKPQSYSEGEMEQEKKEAIIWNDCISAINQIETT